MKHEYFSPSNKSKCDNFPNFVVNMSRLDFDLESILECFFSTLLNFVAASAVSAIGVKVSKILSENLVKNCERMYLKTSL